MKAFVLIMVFNQHSVMVPATEEFHTGPACLTRLQQQTRRMMEADGGQSGMRVLHVAGQPIIIINTQRYVAWCQPSWLLPSDIRQQIASAVKVP
jgi:hypothetical protein